MSDTEKKSGKAGIGSPTIPAHEEAAPEKRAAEEVAAVTEAISMNRPQPRYSYDEKHYELLLAKGFTPDELESALETANRVWAEAPESEKPVGALSNALMAIAVQKGLAASGAAQAPKPAPKAATKGKGKTKKVEKPKAKRADLASLTPEERRERRLQQKREANKRWREKMKMKASKPPKAAEAKERPSTIGKMTENEKILLATLTGITHETIRPRKVSDLAHEAFPDESPKKAEAKARPVVASLVRGGLATRPKRGVVLPSRQGILVAGEEALASIH